MTPVTLALIPFRADPQPSRKAGLLRRAKRWGMMSLGLAVIALGVMTVAFLMFEVWFKVPLFKGALQPLRFLGY